MKLPTTTWPPEAMNSCRGRLCQPRSCTARRTRLDVTTNRGPIVDMLTRMQTMFRRRLPGDGSHMLRHACRGLRRDDETDETAKRGLRSCRIHSVTATDRATPRRNAGHTAMSVHSGTCTGHLVASELVTLLMYNGIVPRDVKVVACALGVGTHRSSARKAKAIELMTRCA